MRRILAPLLASMLLLTACGPAARSPDPAPSTASAAPSPAPVPPPATNAVTITPPASPGPYWSPPGTSLTVDVPTFPAQERLNPYGWPAGISVPQPSSPTTVAAVLGRLVDELVSTGKPTVPDGLPAAYAGTLAGEHHVFVLSLSDQRPQSIYQVQREGSGWSATPICDQTTPNWVWPGTLTEQSPVLICAGRQGSGSNLSVTVYKGGRAVFSAGGLSEGAIAVGNSANGPPPLILTGKRQWLDHKLDPWVLERFTFTWQGDTYKLAQHERMADRNYHWARFHAFVAAGDLDKAAGEWAVPPAGGMAAYLDAQAPHLRGMVGLPLTWSGVGNTLHPPGPLTQGPWFAYDFAADGRITGVHELNEAPVQPKWR